MDDACLLVGRNVFIEQIRAAGVIWPNSSSQAVREWPSASAMVALDSLPHPGAG
jgi:hypothetical protein